MLVKIFRRQHNINFVVLFVTTLLLWTPSFFYDIEITNRTEPLYNLVLLICFNSPIVIKIIGFITLLFSAGLLNNIVNKYGLCSIKTDLAGLLYILFASAFTHILYVTPVLIGNLVLLWVINNLFDIDKQKKTITKMFDIGLLIGLATLCYFPVIYFVLLVFFTTLVIGSVKWRDWLAVLLGFLVPYVMYFSYLYLTDSSSNFVFELALQSNFTSYNFDILTYEYVYLVTLLVIAIMSIYTYLIRITSMLSKVRKYSWILFIATLLPILYYLSSLEMEVYHWLLITVPLAVFFTNVLLEFKRKIYAELLLYTLVTIIIYGQISSYLTY